MGKLGVEMSISYGEERKRISGGFDVIDYYYIRIGFKRYVGKIGMRFVLKFRSVFWRYVDSVYCCYCDENGELVERCVDYFKIPEWEFERLMSLVDEFLNKGDWYMD